MADYRAKQSGNWNDPGTFEEVHERSLWRRFRLWLWRKTHPEATGKGDTFTIPAGVTVTVPVGTVAKAPTPQSSHQ